ncbi:hypothetical protein ACOMHN_021005 [Nucella lapillus]
MAGSMSYHMEARLKQDRMNRWSEERRRAEVTHQGLKEKHEDVAYRQQMGKVLSADPGQFNQISSDHTVFHKHRNAQNLPEDNVFPLIHPKGKNFRVPRDQLPQRKPHLKV